MLIGLLGTGQTVHVFSSAAPQPGVFAVVGMAAYFTAIDRGPLTEVILISEMTGNYEQILSLPVSCFCAYAVAEYLKDIPIYEALLERDLVRGGVHIDRQAPFVVEFEAEPGSTFVGREVRELGLPLGCTLVRFYEDGRESIPTSSTRLNAHTRITAMLSSEAIASLQLLRKGCAAKPE